ncbi:ATP-binding protein, partial [bacterium]|nr:ATP-binding protein [bacterium]
MWWFIEDKIGSLFNQLDPLACNGVLSQHNSTSIYRIGEFSMSKGDSYSSKVFGRLFTKFMEKMVAQTPDQESEFVRLFADHFQTDVSRFPIVTEEFEEYDHANIQLAVEGYLGSNGRNAEFVGVNVDNQFMQATLPQLVKSNHSGLFGGSNPTLGPVQYKNINLQDDQTIACVDSGLYLIKNLDQRFAVLIRGPAEPGFNRKIAVDVMAPERSAAEKFLVEIRQWIRKKNIYKGKVISLSQSDYRGINIHFRRLPQIAREQIVLPDGLLNRIERQTVNFTKHSQKLLMAGRHLKRGMLLHGPPGTGKTLTAMFLASQLQERTVIILTGTGLGTIQNSCVMARLLQPSIVILEDVDLVAEERTRPGAACTALLFELLNQMDGIAEDVDVLFLLTTNRPDILEPALASRPGRIDQAIELPLPDAKSRNKLFDLYGTGLNMELSKREEFIRRMEGVSAAFIRELLRKASL